MVRNTRGRCLLLILVHLGTCASVVLGQSTQRAVHVTLTDAVKAAQANETTFVNAFATQRTASIDSYLAKVALLPTVKYHNQGVYTQPNRETTASAQGGSEAGYVFIANNAVREYVSQGTVDETIGFRQVSETRIAAANAARATAELEIARRGLVSTVVGLYYGVTSAERKQGLLAQALNEAQSFTDLTQKREAAREVAHADVLKAQLQQQQKQRDLTDAVLAAGKARLELGVLLFQDPRTPYTTDAPSGPQPLLSREELNRLAGDRNPEIRSALAGINAATAGVSAARAAYLPDLALNFTYGIDAPQFAKRGPGDVRNLGYSFSGTLDIPVFDWFATEKRVKQSEIQRDAARVGLTAAQRRLVANIEESYAEAAATREQLTLLDQSATTAAESLRLTNLRYAAGEATALEVVDAQNALLSAQTAQADGIVRYQTALTSLQVLTGTL